MVIIPSLHRNRAIWGRYVLSIWFHRSYIILWVSLKIGYLYQNILLIICAPKMQFWGIAPIFGPTDLWLQILLFCGQNPAPVGRLFPPIWHTTNSYGTPRFSSATWCQNHWILRFPWWNPRPPQPTEGRTLGGQQQHTDPGRSAVGHLPGPIHYWVVVEPYPSEKIWVRWDSHSQCMENKKCSKPPNRLSLSMPCKLRMVKSNPFCQCPGDVFENHIWSP